MSEETKQTIWERAAAEHAATRNAMLEHHHNCAECQRGNWCGEGQRLITEGLAHPHYPTGVTVIKAGECPKQTDTPLRCMVCELGHMLECHAPQRCAEADCRHLANARMNL